MSCVCKRDEDGKIFQFCMSHFDVDAYILSGVFQVKEEES